jgi:hypothetical protein
VKLARVAEDPKLCVEAIEGIWPLPMDHVLLESRVLCFKQANDPRLPDAEVEFGRLLTYTRPFGADIPTPPGQKRLLPPPFAPRGAPSAPTALEDAGLAPGSDAGRDAESSSP